jgi:hypothetical protein
MKRRAGSGSYLLRLNPVKLYVNNDALAVRGVIWDYAVFQPKLDDKGKWDGESGTWAGANWGTGFVDRFGLPQKFKTRTTAEIQEGFQCVTPKDLTAAIKDKNIKSFPQKAFLNLTNKHKAVVYYAFIIKGGNKK